MPRRSTIGEATIVRTMRALRKVGWNPDRVALIGPGGDRLEIPRGAAGPDAPPAPADSEPNDFD